MDLLVASKFLHPPYFDSKTCAHSSPWWLNKFQHHFSSKAKLNFPKSLIPKPPFSFGKQIVPQFSQTIFFSFEFPPHRNCLYSPTSLSIVFFSTLKKEKKRIGISSGLTIRVTLPPKERYFYFLFDSFLLHFLTTGSHVSLCREFATMGTPK